MTAPEEQDDADERPTTPEEAEVEDRAAEKERPEAPASDARADARADWGFPRFARGYPRDERLDALVLAFTKGDYRAVRDGAAKLADSDADEAVRAAARELRARTEPDPTAKVLFVLTALLLVFLSAFWVTHDGPPKGEPAPTKPVPTVEFPR